MKTLIILTASIISLNSSFATCMEQVKKDAQSRSFLFLQDSIETVYVTETAKNTFEVFAQTELDPEYTYVEGTYQVKYNTQCKEVSYKVIKPMTEGTSYPDFDYSRPTGTSAPCDHCGDEYDQ